jgi:hypothetical protein
MIGLWNQKKEKQASDQPFRCSLTFVKGNEFLVRSCSLVSVKNVLEMPKGEKCLSLSKYKDGVYSLHFKRAKLVNGCWNKTIPDKYLKKENGEVIAYEKLGNAFQEKGRAQSMVDGRCLWGKGSINWKCSFQGQPVNGNIGNAATTLDLKGKGEKSTQKLPPTGPTWKKIVDKPKGAKSASTHSFDKQGEAEDESSSETNRSLIPSPCAAAIVVGARVEARFDDDKTLYYPGVVTAVQNGTCAITFDDGDADDCVPFTDLRLLKTDTKCPVVAGILKCTSTVSLAHFPSLAFPILSSSFLSLASPPEFERQKTLSDIVHDCATCDKWEEGVSRYVQLNSDANAIIAKTALVQGQVVLQVKG